MDFLLPDVIDGLPPITRLGARIQDAEERGYVFETIGWRDRCKVYRLLSEPEAAPSDRRMASVGDAASDVGSLPQPEQPPLFETPGADFRSPTIDGGPEIRNVTPRVSDLRRVHGIASERGADGCAKYSLTWDRGDNALPFDEIVAEAREAVDDESEQLALELPPTGSPARSAIDDDWDIA